MIIEILNAIWGGFWGFIKEATSIIPAIVELKDVVEKLTPIGIITEYLVYLGVPAVLITTVAFIIKKAKI